LIQEEEKKYIINTYNRQPGVNLYLVKGEGTRVWDEGGKEYLDFVGGLAVNGLGHCFQPVVEAATAQLNMLIHTSNLYYTGPQVELARRLVEASAADKVFFCNSGAEANEAAIKLARKYSKQQHGAEKHEIITAKNSFHGRTLATITATGQAKFHQGFEPLVPGFRYGDFNDADSFASQVNRHTCAVMLEPVQGEGGVHVATGEFISAIKQLCEQHKLLLILDEIQCGMGRTGKLFAYEHYGIIPDIFTLAKSLGGGLPIGAMLCTDSVAAGFSPGDHASTFGGNPVVCAAASAVMDQFTQEGFLETVEGKGQRLVQGLTRLKERFPAEIQEVRGLGLMIGLQVSGQGKRVQGRAMEKGLLINCIGENVLRLLPPLNVSEEDLEQAVDILGEVFEESRP